MQTPPLRIGTRGSPLALAQAREVAALLAAAGGETPVVIPIRTSGDRITDRPLSEIGGKGLFTKEIEEALLAGTIDIAVHSAKDMPTALPPGLIIAATPEREDVRDAFLSPQAENLAALPRGAVLGTSSLRRKALALLLRPDLRVIDFRGNVATRLRKLDEGVAAATLLALAGLKRLGLAHRATSILSPDDFPPAVGQGTIAIEARAADGATLQRLAAIDHRASALCLAAERAFLTVLDGSCRTPIGGLARIEGGRLRFAGIIVTPDGRKAHRVTREGAAADAARIGRDAGEELARLGGPAFFAAS